MTTPAGPRRAAFAFIFVTVLLDMLALGMVIPVLPALVLEFEGGDTAHAAHVVGIFGTVWALMQFVASPVVGALSDRFGRRPIILASNFGLGFDYLLMALAPNLSWLFVGRVISGITAASISTSHAYIADLLPPERRSHAFGLLGAAFGLGFVLGPALGGVLGNVDPRLPFWVAAGLSLANAMYGIFILPESLPPERRARFDWRAANPLGSLRLLRSHPELLGLAAVNFLGNTAHYVLPSTMVLYAMYRYGWDQQQVGFVMAAIGACAIVVQAGLVRPVVTALGERRTALAALLFGAAGFAAYGLAPSALWYLLAVPLQALWGLYGPAASTLMTQRVDATEQGKLQGATQSLNGIAGMIAPTMFAAVFAWFIGSGAPWHVPGAPFLLAGLLLLAAGALLWRTTSEVQVR